MEIEGLFQTPILVGNLNNDLDKIQKECLNRSTLSKGKKVSNFGGWQSENIFSDDPFFSGLIQQIQDITLDFAKKIQIDLSNNSDVQMWININGYKDSNIIHDHPKSIFSGVYYIKVPKNSGSIRFYHPAHNKLERDWCDLKIESYNFYNSLIWTLSSLENRIIIFPSWLNHLVEQNLSHEQRISISFNVGVA